MLMLAVGQERAVGRRGREAGKEGMLVQAGYIITYDNQESKVKCKCRKGMQQQR